VHESIDHGGGHGVVAEDLAPATEGLVGGHDDRGAFVAGGDQLEEQVGVPADDSLTGGSWGRGGGPSSRTVPRLGSRARAHAISRGRRINQAPSPPWPPPVSTGLRPPGQKARVDESLGAEWLTLENLIGDDAAGDGRHQRSILRAVQGRNRRRPRREGRTSAAHGTTAHVIPNHGVGRSLAGDRRSCDASNDRAESVIWTDERLPTRLHASGSAIAGCPRTTLTRRACARPIPPNTRMIHVVSPCLPHEAGRWRVPVGRPPLTLSVCCSSPATMAVRHLGDTSFVVHSGIE
jgi:hypothetical protein